MIQAAIFSVLFFIISCVFQAQGIYGGDSGDLVTAAVTFGVPHPPGYPLYTALGWLFSQLPILTPTWRVTLVSSLSHAIVLYVVYLTTFVMLKNKIAALFAICVLAGNYLFVLYTLTPEVFALHNLFVAILTYLLYQAVTHKKARTFIMAFFVYGLALTHHPIVLCLLPAWVYVGFRLRIDVLLTVQERIRAVVAFVAGLLPFLYIPIAAHGSSIVNWDRAVNINQFIKLITRGDYGTFVSSAAAGTEMYHRFINIRAYVDFFVLDFSFVGCVLLAAGSVWLFFHKREFFIAWVISLLCAGPAFYFYASFPLGGRFTLGTYERFMLPSYILMAPVIGIGLYAAVHGLVNHIKGIRHISRKSISALFLIAAFLYPLMVGGISVWRFAGLAQDKTAENFALDILASSPPKAIVLLVHDVTLFTTQYVRYGTGVRPDTIVLQFSRLRQPDYQEVIKRIFPDLIIPENSANFMSEFISKNRMFRPIVSNSLFPVPEDLEWLPNGFLYVLVPSSETQNTQDVLQANKMLWDRYHNPAAGILGRYHHLMLSNVLDEYATAAVNYGEILGQIGKYSEALEVFNRAVSYGSDGKSEDAYIKRGMTQAILGDCTEALLSLSASQKFAAVENRELPKYRAIIYRDCVRDASRAAELFSEYDAVKKKDETPLEQL